MLVRPPEPRPPTRVDYAARLLSSVLPASATPAIDQTRRDLGVLVRAVQGERPEGVATIEKGVSCAPPLEDIDPLDLLGRWGERVRGAQRDYRVVRDQLVYGKRPPPLVQRPPRHPEKTEVVQLGGAPSPTVSRPLVVTRVVQETADAVSIYLTEADGSPLRFVAGQFVSVDVHVDGEMLRRAYSIAAPATEGAEAHVTIKRVPDGRVSNHLCDTATEDARLDALGPSGSFTWAATTGARQLVLVAGGSGITPVISIAETALRKSDARVVLVYGNRGEADIIFRARLDALTNEFGDRLTVDHVLSEASDAWQGPRGLLDADTLRARLEALDVLPQPDGEADLYVCGPTPMMDAARALFTDLGVTDRLHEERFSRPEDRAEARGSDTPQPMTIERGGKRHTYVVQPGQTLLEAAKAGGEEMPFSCAMGGCGACKMRTWNGGVVMDEPNCLTAREREEGYVLTCVGRPTGPVTLVADDKGGAR